MKDLLVPDIADRDHIRGSRNAPMRLLVYGDYECPYTRKALISVAQLRGQLGDRLVFGFRHFPLVEIHPHALHAALAAEAASLQDRFWAMHDLLFHRQDSLTDADLISHARQVGLELGGFRSDFVGGKGLPRIEEDVESGLRNGVQGTPGIFINGKIHRDAYDRATLLYALSTNQQGERG